MSVTPKAQALLDFVAKSIIETGAAPTVAEMGAALGLRSKSGVCRMLDQLVTRGRIRRIPNRARAIEIISIREQVDPEIVRAVQALAAQVMIGRDLELRALAVAALRSIGIDGNVLNQKERR